MSEPTTEAGKMLLVSLAAFPQGPGSAIFGQDCRNRIAAIEAEAVEQWLASPEAERRLAEAIDAVDSAVWRLGPSTKWAEAIIAALRSQPTQEGK